MKTWLWHINHNRKLLDDRVPSERERERKEIKGNQHSYSWYHYYMKRSWLFLAAGLRLFFASFFHLIQPIQPRQIRRVEKMISFQVCCFPHLLFGGGRGTSLSLPTPHDYHSICLCSLCSSSHKRRVECWNFYKLSRVREIIIQTTEKLDSWACSGGTNVRPGLFVNFLAKSWKAKLLSALFSHRIIRAPPCFVINYEHSNYDSTKASGVQR